MLTFPIPEILQCKKTVTKSPGWQRRTVRDYEFDFYFAGEREMYLDENRYRIIDGCLIFRKPGQVIYAYGDYNAYMLTVDFSGDNAHLAKGYKRSSSTPQQRECSLDILGEIPEVFIPHHRDELTELYVRLCELHSEGNEREARRALSEFLFLVLSDAYRYLRESTQIKQKGEEYVQAVKEYISKSYQKPLSVDDMARHVNLSKNYLIRLFRKELGITPNKYLTDTRLYNARLLLTRTKLSVKSIGISCGFSTPSYFIKCFREHFSETPLEYRASLGRIENI